MTRLAGATWIDAERAGVLVVPVGATEQHGPHLPTGTDTVIAGELVDRLEAARPEAWIAPSISIGASGEHAGFPGTLSMGQAALVTVLIEIGRSADAFDGLYFVNWHGGNRSALDSAVAKLREEGRWADRWRPGTAVPGFDLHAGRAETSMMLAIDPGSVRLGLTEAGNGDRSPAMLRRLREEGVRAVSPNGVLGDPSGADAREGRRILDELARDVIAGFDRVSGRTSRAG